MSAECEKCGHDLDPNLKCIVCDLEQKVTALQNVFDAATSELYKWGSENVGDNSDFWDIWVKFKRFDGDAK